MRMTTEKFQQTLCILDTNTRPSVQWVGEATFQQWMTFHSISFQANKKKKQHYLSSGELRSKACLQEKGQSTGQESDGQGEVNKMGVGGVGGMKGEGGNRRVGSDWGKVKRTLGRKGRIYIEELGRESLGKRSVFFVPHSKKEQQKQNKPIPWLFNVRCARPWRKEQKKRKKGKNEVIKRHGKEKNHCHNVGLQFVTDILGQTWMSEFELKAKIIEIK